MHYSSKILLFGEHTVNRGSNALAIPYSAFGGEWAYSEDFQLQQNLADFWGYLENLQQKGELLADLNLNTFQVELAKGLYFDSKIPIGYGLGSSGALCAAVYDRFCDNKIERAEKHRYAELKRVLAQLECFFHGASSATDVLGAYLNQPILIRSDGQVQTVALPQSSELTFFLIDTKLIRSAGTWVQFFLKYCEKADFLAKVTDQLAWQNNEAIDAFLKSDWDKLYKNTQAISRFHIGELFDMIPKAFHQIWKEGLQCNLYYLKICGAGGGGFILGVTFDWEKTKDQLSNYDLRKIDW